VLPRLLWISESPGARTGAGRLSEELLGRLADRYEIGVLCWPLPLLARAVPYTVLEAGPEPWACDRIAAAWEEFQADLIVTLGPVENWLKLARTPLRHFAAWVGALPLSSKPVPAGWKEGLANLDERVVFGTCVRKWLKDTSPHLTATVVPMGVDLQCFHPLPTREALRERAGLSEAFVIGCVACNEPRQYLSRLLEAVARFREENDSIFLYLHVDPDGGGGDLVAQVQYYGLSDRTGFSYGVTGWSGVSLSELNEIYNLCDVLVLPGPGQRYGLTLLEGLAAGIPVLAVGGGLAEEFLPRQYPRLRAQTHLFLPETGERAPLMDVGHLVAELRSLARDSGRRALLAQRGLVHVKAFSWERAIQGWREVLDRAWSRSPRPRLFPVGRPGVNGASDPRSEKDSSPSPESLQIHHPSSGVRPQMSLLLWTEVSPERLRRCLETIWAQEMEGLEVWILDPGHSLKRIHALRPWLAGRPLHYLPVLERGPISAFNLALQRAAGDILGVWSADQLFSPGVLQQVREVFSHLPCADLAVGQTEYGGVHSGLALPVVLGPATLGSEHHLFFRREVWKELGDFTCLHPAAALVDYQIRALQAGFRLHFMDFILGQREVAWGSSRLQAETRECHLAYVQGRGTGPFNLSEAGQRNPHRPPLVSVVLPTYNQASLLPEALESVRAQTYPHWELILVNDGSTDGTETVLSRYHDPRFKIVTLPQNRGLPRALNEGFRRAQGDYVTFTSSDNLLHPQLLERLVEVLEEHSHIGVAYADYEEIGDRSRVISLAAVTPEDIAERGWSLGPAFLIRSSVLDEYGWPPYDETLAGIEDTALWLDLSRRTLFHHVPQVLYSYRRHPGQFSAQLERRQGYEPLRAALRQRRSRQQLGLSRPIPRPESSDRRKILFLYRHACHGGVEVALWHLLPALLEQGFEAELCFLTDQGGAALFKDICPLHVLGTDDPRKAIPRLRRIIASGDYDLLHQIAVPWATEALAGTGFTGPVVAGCHGNVALLQGVTARNTDALLLVSDYLRCPAQAVVPDLEPWVIPNGLDLTRFQVNAEAVEALRRREGLPGDRRLLAWIGRLGPEKDWPFFLILLAALLSRRRDVAGVLVGGGEADESTQQYLAAQVEAAGLSPFFFWKPLISPPMMPAFYGLVARTRGLVLSTSQEEAFGLTLVEAMASGIPVIAPAVGGIPEVIRHGETGTLLDPQEPVMNWVQAIESVLDEEGLYDCQAERGRAWVAERFDVRAVAARHAALYESLLEKHKSPCVVVLSGTPWTEAGGGQRPRKLAETLSRLGWRVLFLQQFGPPSDPWGYVEIQTTRAVTEDGRRGRSFAPETQQAIEQEIRELLRRNRPMLVINCVCTELARLQMAVCQQMGARGIYDCMDDWGAFARMQRQVYGEDAGYEEAIERRICQQADRVVVTAPVLGRRLWALGGLQAPPLLVPNGLDSAFLRRRIGPRPADLPPGERILGYTGCLWGDWQDWELVKFLAQSRPEWSFVLIGPYSDPLEDLFHGIPNVFFLGPRPHARLHEYIDCFDVGLIPFKAGDFVQTISPLKVFDYLARGKPVVAPPMETLAGYPYTWAATTPEEWLIALEEAFSMRPGRGGSRTAP
jgi:glycosyltransferase involved in cell wall biosynthesis